MSQQTVVPQLCNPVPKTKCEVHDWLRLLKPGGSADKPCPVNDFQVSMALASNCRTSHEGSFKPGRSYPDRTAGDAAAAWQMPQTLSAQPMPCC